MTRETGLANCKMVPVLIGTFRYDIRTALRPLCGHRFVSRPIAIGDFVEIQRQRRFFERTENCPSMLLAELLRPLLRTVPTVLEVLPSLMAFRRITAATESRNWWKWGG